MGMFNQPKPRGFHHEYMFVNTRKEKLQAIENKAKNELGLTNDDSVRHHEYMRGTFLNATKHVRRHHERKVAGGLVLSFGMIVVLLLLLFAAWKMLLSL